MAPDSGEEQTSRPVLGCAPDTPQSSSKKAAAKEGEGEGKEEEEEAEEEEEEEEGGSEGRRETCEILQCIRPRPSTSKRGS